MGFDRHHHGSGVNLLLLLKPFELRMEKKKKREKMSR